MFYGVLQHSGAEFLAHDTISAAAQHDRWASLIRGSGLTCDQAQSAIESEVFGPLTAELRRIGEAQTKMSELRDEIMLCSR